MAIKRGPFHTNSIGSKMLTMVGDVFYAYLKTMDFYLFISHTCMHVYCSFNRIGELNGILFSVNSGEQWNLPLD